MRIIYILFLILLITKISFSNDIFETNVYELNFSSNDINLVKEKKINEIKIKSFKSLIKKLLTDENIKRIKLNDINFVNTFILNYKIKNEKIINNNYYSKIKINFNEDLIIHYLIENQIQFVDKMPDKFLIIIFEQNNLHNYLFSKENNYYQFLIKSTNTSFNKYFLIPNLDYNDRFLFNKYHFENDVFQNNNLINKKYKTEYQILINSIRSKNLIINDVFLFHDNNKYFVTKIPIKNLDYENLFNNILSSTLNKWKILNQIDTSLYSMLECEISINNIYELSYVRNLLKSNKWIDNLILKSIELNKNLYQISFIGNIDSFKNSLQKDRLNLFFNNNTCNIKLI